MSDLAAFDPPPSPPPPSYEISQFEFDRKTSHILEQSAHDPPQRRVDDDGFEIWDEAVFEAALNGVSTLSAGHSRQPSNSDRRASSSFAAASPAFSPPPASSRNSSYPPEKQRPLPLPSDPPPHLLRVPLLVQAPGQGRTWDHLHRLRCFLRPHSSKSGRFAFRRRRARKRSARPGTLKQAWEEAALRRPPSTLILRIIFNRMLAAHLRAQYNLCCGGGSLFSIVPMKIARLLHHQSSLPSGHRWMGRHTRLSL
uniref:Mitogen-activated protein kinase kinase n=1 Tax=Ganoderma boninense TaxID=34458 RepID=A0A5K1JUS3_9APHY|nr:Mitogen-activated protein kinase kinase [Ganoderma boninense]